MIAEGCFGGGGAIFVAHRVLSRRRREHFCGGGSFSQQRVYFHDQGGPSEYFSKMRIPAGGIFFPIMPPTLQPDPQIKVCESGYPRQR